MTEAHKQSGSPCALCSAHSFAFVLQGPDLRLPLSGEFTLYRCTQCGLVALRPHPAPDVLAVHYAAQIWQPTAARSEMTRAKFAPLVDLLRRRHPQRGRLLDVGCGPGDFVEMVSEEGWDAQGLEVDAAQVEYARTQGRNVQLWPDFVTYSDDVTYDVITFNHVLEHVPDPVAYLRKATRLLKPEGLLVVSVPNFAGVTRRIFGKYWMHLDLPRHLFHFSPETMQRALTTAGLQVEAPLFIDRIQDSLGMRNSLRRWLFALLPSRRAQVSAGAAVETPPGPMMSLLRATTDLLAQLAERYHCADTFTIVATPRRPIVAQDDHS